MNVKVSRHLNKRLATYASAAGAIGAVMSSEAEAVVVTNSTPQAFGVNGVVDIDFNSDGQIDFQIDHDRVDLGANGIRDYLQIDKADINSELNPLPFDTNQTNPAIFQAQTFPPNMTNPNDANDSAYVVTGIQGSYPAALPEGTPIGSASMFDFQENDSFQFSGDWIRANRLIDEDMTSIDQILGGRDPSQIQAAFGTPGWTGLGGETRYLGMKMDLNGTGAINYGWIGVRITNEQDATGEVTGWAYQTIPNLAIEAGRVPEPGTVVSVLLGGVMAGCFLWRRIFRR